MRRAILHFAVALCVSIPASSQSSPPRQTPTNGGDFSDATSQVTKVPAGVILVKGAWSSASDSVTPVPEGSTFVNNVFSNQYFGINYSLPATWAKNYDGPPPSDSGRYVLAQIKLGGASKESPRGSVLISADDLFFTPLKANNALQIVNYLKDNLQADYKQEEPPTPTKIAGHPFTFFAYWSPAAQLHWYILATQIRCHAVEMVLTSRDTKLLSSLLLDLDKMTLPAEAGPTTGTGGGAWPVCVKDYARKANVLERVEPILTEHRANPVPVRIIIDKQGKVKHIHFLSAFPDQAKAITDALGQWKFKPYLQAGQPVEVETGIMFGRAPRWTPTSGSSVE
jgi:hypothetical protein